jgi:uncharacterized protein
MLTLVDDASGGAHDLLFTACDAHRYEQLGVKGFHDNCTKNLVTQLDKTLAFSKEMSERNLSGAITSANLSTGSWTPDPLNLFMNVPVRAVGDGKGGKMSLATPSCPREGYVVLRAEVECMVIMSACPMDLTSIYEN